MEALLITCTFIIWFLKIWSLNLFRVTLCTKTRSSVSAWAFLAYPLFWNFTVESVLQRKLDALSIQVFSEEYNVVGVKTFWMKLLYWALESAFEFVYKEDLAIRHPQCAFSPELPWRETVFSSILAGALKGTVACVGKGRGASLRANEVSGSVECQFPSLGFGGLEEKIMGKVRGPTLVGRRVTWCFSALVHLRASEPQRVVREWLGRPSFATPELLWLGAFYTRPGLNNHPLGVLWGSSKCPPAISHFI